ncbi:Spindle and kinetochore-associated protein 1 [Bulinus truncatus]|nr:Spindle and kinetochore-associated protein 1 [Bulinus truncatus]
MRQHVENAKTHLEHKEKINIQVKRLIEQTQHALDNVPSRLPKIKPQHTLSITSMQEIVDNSKSEPEVNFSECQYLRFLTVQEFEGVPKYIKGRLTYDKVNQIIEQLDQAYRDKYKILGQKKATLSDLNRKRCEIYRSQESKDTKGIHFIVEKDVTEFTNLKLDISARNTLTILRHCGLIHEIRGGSIVRYAAV